MRYLRYFILFLIVYYTDVTFNLENNIWIFFLLEWINKLRKDWLVVEILIKLR
jgi:hypothetical protein